MSARVRRCGPALVLITTLAASSAAPAAIREALDEPGLAARIDGRPLSLNALQVLQKATAERDRVAPLPEVLAAVIRDRVLADYAEREIGDLRLFDNANVAFSPATLVELSLAATLQRVYRQPLQEALGRAGGLERLVTQRFPLHGERLATLLGVSNRPMLRLEVALTPAQLQGLKEVPLLEYRLGTAPAQRITLADIWVHLNVQGRNALFNLDTGFAMRQAEQLVANRFIRHWATTQGGLSEADLNQIAQAIADRDRRAAFGRWIGADSDMHYASDHLDRLASGVTTAEVSRYYQAHREAFVRTERVKARHILCPDEACSDAAYAQLQQGKPFAEVARRWSVAPSGKRGGSLGWIPLAKAKGDWLGQLAFAQPPGPPTLPVRQPPGADGKAAWQIVQVEKRVTGHYPLHSETVRYIASRSIAKQKAVAEYEALRDRLVEAAAIDVNARLLGLKSGELKIKG